MVNHPDSCEGYIKEAVKIEIDSIHVPEMEDVWSNIEKALARQQQKEVLYKYKRIAVGAAAALILGLALGGTGSDYLLNNKAYRLLTEALEKSVVMQVNYKKEVKRPDAEAIAASVPKQYTLSFEEAAERADYPIKAPATIPQGYELSEVRLTEMADKTVSIKLLYSDKQNNVLTVKQVPIDGKLEEIVEGASKGAAVTMQRKAGYTYFIMDFTNGSTKVYWDMGQTRFLAEGREKELVTDLAFSIK
jgi:hypothetical protein